MDITTSSQPTQPAAKDDAQAKEDIKKEAATQAPETAASPPRRRSSDSYSDYFDDLVERVRAAKAEAQRRMETFGRVSEYEIRKLYGQRTDINYDEPVEASESKPDEQKA